VKNYHINLIALVVITATGRWLTAGVNGQEIGSPFSKTRSAPGALSPDSVCDPEIDWPLFYGVQQTGRLNATFTSVGGFGDWIVPMAWRVPCWPQASFESPPGSGIEYLLGGSIWVGGILDGDTLVSTGWTGDSWYPVDRLLPPQYSQKGSVQGFEYAADYSMRTEFTDTIAADSSLGLRLANRSHVWRSPPYGNSIIYDLVITNIGPEPIHDVYLGLFFDAQALSPATPWEGYCDDICGAVRAEQMAWAIDNNGDPWLGQYSADSSVTGAFAARFLEMSFQVALTNFNWWATRVGKWDKIDFGPRQRGTEAAPFWDFGTGGLGIPTGDANKYYMMSFPEWDYDQPYTASILPYPLDTIWLQPEETLARRVSKGVDIRFLLSVGPFELLPDSSERVIYATFTADSVHTDPYNYGDHLPYYPYAYLINLNLERLVDNGRAAKSKAAGLLDPTLPPIGFHLEYVCADSAVFEWDPWVFDDVAGVNLYLTEVDPAELPYPGVLPPWLKVETADRVIELGRGYRYTLEGINPSTILLANIANRLDDGIGALSSTASFWMAERPEAPSVIPFAATSPGHPVMISWQAPETNRIACYNIYRFADTVEAAGRYLAFYDRGRQSDEIEPADTLYVDGTTYYYYALETYRQVPAPITSFEDETFDGCVYVITAVDSSGMESEMTGAVRVDVVEPASRDILVVTNATPFCEQITPYPAIRDFYETVLAGYDYEIMSILDFCAPPDPATCPTLADLAPYRMVIVDDVLHDLVPNATLETATHLFERCLLAGRRVVYFGAFSSFMHFGTNTAPQYRPVEDRFIPNYFGADSILYVGLGYFAINHLPLVDTLFGFNYAEPTGFDLPDLATNPAAYPMGPAWESHWPASSPPSVAAFHTCENGLVTHRYRSYCPASSMFEGLPVGLRTVGRSWETFLFGFHLYYMRPDHAQNLIEAIVNLPTPVTEDQNNDIVPSDFSLGQNYPNPFNSSTNIEFDLPYRTQVQLVVYNVLGREVMKLVDRELPAGSHRVEWDGTDFRGKPLASGIYFYRLTADGQKHDVKKMLLLK
jgi:hypothetical protein